MYLLTAPLSFSAVYGKWTKVFHIFDEGQANLHYSFYTPNSTLHINQIFQIQFLAKEYREYNATYIWRRSATAAKLQPKIEALLTGGRDIWRYNAIVRAWKESRTVAWWAYGICFCINHDLLTGAWLTGVSLPSGHVTLINAYKSFRFVLSVYDQNVTVEWCVCVLCRVKYDVSDTCGAYVECIGGWVFLLKNADFIRSSLNGWIW